MQNQIFTRNIPTAIRLYQEAVRHFLMVKMLRDQLIGDVKFSEPMWKQELADTANQPSLNLVEFSAEQLKFSTSAPTTRQVESLFNDYRHVQPNHATTNPGDVLGLGYEVPNRVKLQYLWITRKQAFDAAKAARNAYDLDVEAREYLLRNLSKFVRCRRPPRCPRRAHHANRRNDSAINHASRHNTARTRRQRLHRHSPHRPYAEVKDEILDTLISPDAEKLQLQVAKALHDRLAADYANYRLSNPTTAPSTFPSLPPSQSPATRPAAYTSYGYLEASL